MFLILCGEFANLDSVNNKKKGGDSMKKFILAFALLATAFLNTGCSTTGKKVNQSHSVVLHEGGY